MKQVPRIPANQIVLWTLGVLLVCGAFWVLWHFHYTLILLLAAIFISTAIKPLIHWLEKHGVAKPLGILLVFGALGLLLVLFIWLALPLFAGQGEAVADTLGDGYGLLLQNLRRLPNILVHRLLAILPSDPSAFMVQNEELPDQAAEEPLAELLVQGRLLLRGLVTIVAVILLTVFWTLEGERIRQAALLLMPIDKRGGARALLEEIDAKIGSYLLGQGLLCLSIGLLAFLVYMLIGLPHALLLAMFAGLMEAVPVAGPFIGAIPALIIALTVSPITALWVALGTIIIQQLENNLLVPRIMNRAIGVGPLVTLLALLAFGSMFGILGALIALPLAAVAQLLLDRFVLADDTLAQVDDGRDRLSRLRYETNQLVQDVRHHIRNKETMASAHSDAVEDEVEAIALDLQSLLAAQEGMAQ
jgi:predicted PurR-regulated permease PerM